MTSMQPCGRKVLTLVFTMSAMYCHHLGHCMTSWPSVQNLCLHNRYTCTISTSLVEMGSNQLYHARLQNKLTGNIYSVLASTIKFKRKGYLVQNSLPTQQLLLLAMECTGVYTSSTEEFVINCNPLQTNITTTLVGGVVQPPHCHCYHCQRTHPLLLLLLLLPHFLHPPHQPLPPPVSASLRTTYKWWHKIQKESNFRNWMKSVTPPTPRLVLRGTMDRPPTWRLLGVLSGSPSRLLEDLHIKFRCCLPTWWGTTLHERTGIPLQVYTYAA